MATSAASVALQGPQGPPLTSLTVLDKLRRLGCLRAPVAPQAQAASVSQRRLEEEVAAARAATQVRRGAADSRACAQLHGPPVPDASQAAELCRALHVVGKRACAEQHGRRGRKCLVRPSARAGSQAAQDGERAARQALQAERERREQVGWARRLPSTIGWLSMVWGDVRSWMASLAVQELSAARLEERQRLEERTR
jgi:hypothetical protein